MGHGHSHGHGDHHHHHHGHVHTDEGGTALRRLRHLRTRRGPEPLTAVAPHPGGHQIAVGFGGAPGHQAAGLPAPLGPARARGIYDNNPSANSFPGYPLESYRTWDGFDYR